MEKNSMYNNAVKLYNRLLFIYFNDYSNISNEIKEGEKLDPSNFLIKGYRVLIERKKAKKKVNHNRKKLLLKE